MNVTYVSSLYNLYTDTVFSDILLKNVQFLLNTNLKLIIYVDEFFHDKFKSLQISDTITVILKPIHELIIYNKIMSKNLQLPPNRNIDKDTIEYMALINSKIEFVNYALKLIDTPYIAWIDAGIAKVFNDKIKSFNNLEKLNIVYLDTILQPGCDNVKLTFDDLAKGVSWVFLGGFFICPFDKVKLFYEKSLYHVNKFMDENKIVWEVNIWVDIYNENPSFFTKYYGDHNDDMVVIPNEYIKKYIPTCIPTCIPNCIPNCTLVTACFCMQKYNKYSYTIDNILIAIEAVMEMPCYVVFFGDEITIPIMKERREILNLQHLSKFIMTQPEKLWSFNLLDKVKRNRKIYHLTKDVRNCAETYLITANKFDFVLQIIELNPFNTTKFGWIDCFLSTKDKKCLISENYTPVTILYILNNITDKFHIQILNVNDKKYKLDEYKREYYSKHRYVVCGGMFTCSKSIGLKILSRLKEIIVHTTELGHGHREEMFYLEVLDEFNDDIERSYGDYGQILDNFIKPTRNYNYISQIILKKYVDICYYQEAYNCSLKLLAQIESDQVHVEYDAYMTIMFFHYLTIYYYKKHEVIEFVTHLRDICNDNPLMKNEYNKKKDYYDAQLDYIKYLKPSYNIIICIFACVTIDKYKQELLKINDTWGKFAEMKNIKVLYFLGEESTDLIDPKYVYLKGIKNDCLSASDKQNLGLKYIYDNYNANFVYCCGTDTYINIEKLILYINNLDENKRLFIGGHGDYRQIGRENIYFHSGRSGFILSKLTLEYLYPKLKNMTKLWNDICINNSVSYLDVACDVSIAYFLQIDNFIILEDIIIENELFFACNFLGYSCNNTYCCGTKVNIKKLIACHYMNLSDFDQFTQLLHSNNYFI